MLSWQQYLLMFVGVFCVIALISSVQWMTSGEQLPEKALNVYGFAVTIICAIFFVICLWQGVITNQRIKYKYENEKYEHFMRLQEEQVRNIVDRDMQMRKFCHDMRHHMTVLSTYANDKDYDAITDYIAEIQQQTLINSKISYTNDAAIDAIIGEFSELARKKNIRIDFNIRTSRIGIKSFDMCILLSNLFNNAIEACEKVEDINNRFINVKMVTVDDFLQIVVTNSVDKNIIIKNNELVTTKSDKVNHGIGSTNIKDIVTKYKGNIQYTCDDRIFTSEVALNMIQEL